MKDKNRRRTLVGILILIAVVAYFHFFRQAPIKSQDVTTAAQFLQYYDQKGGKNITWSDFDHLPHETTAPVEGDPNGWSVEYRLKDGNGIYLDGLSMDQAPDTVKLSLVKTPNLPHKNEAKIQAKEIQTKEDVLRYVSQVGVDKVTWSDFDHLPHEEIGSGLYILYYSLKDGTGVILGGFGQEDPPQYIDLHLSPVENQ